MADRDFEIGGSSVFKQRYVDLGGNVYGKAVVDHSVRAGERQDLQRTDVDIRPADVDAILETLQNAATAAGVGTAINVKGYKSATFRIEATSGTWNGGFQATIDDTNWYNVQVVKLSDGAAVNAAGTVANPSQINPSAAAVSELYTLPNLPAAISQIRFNIGARTSGTITVTSRKHPR